MAEGFELWTLEVLGLEAAKVAVSVVSKVLLEVSVKGEVGDLLSILHQANMNGAISTVDLALETVMLESKVIVMDSSELDDISHLVDVSARTMGSIALLDEEARVDLNGLLHARDALLLIVVVGLVVHLGLVLDGFPPFLEVVDGQASHLLPGGSRLGFILLVPGWKVWLLGEQAI